MIYRPPFEAQSYLLEVTKGCSHNQCSFCTMYRDEPFRMLPIDQIEEELKDAGTYMPFVTRVFLENGDAFCLNADRLAQIAELVHRYLPNTRTIAMYASVKNIQGKSDEDLKRLHALGIDELNIGVESGLDDALTHMNKGYTAREAVYELNRLGQAGIRYGANIIFGMAGEGNCREHAEATARLLNETKPYLIFTGTLHADPGCPLYNELKTGAFRECSFGEYLDEEEELLKLLDLEECYYFGLHPSNVVQMHGHLNQDKEEMLQEVRRRREELTPYLNMHPVRRGEGAIVGGK